MRINIKIFNKINIIDSCAIWNILSCNIVYTAAIANGLHFSFTKFVEYECLVRQRSSPSQSDLSLQARLREQLTKGNFKSHSISISDIQEIDILTSRKRLGLGELSSIVFAKKIGQSFLTDDQKARTLASTILGKEKVQTTPHLLGYLFHERHIIDGDLEQIINDHKAHDRPLEPYFRQVYEEALQIRLFDQH